MKSKPENRVQTLFMKWNGNGKFTQIIRLEDGRIVLTHDDHQWIYDSAEDYMENSPVSDLFFIKL